MKFLFLSQFLEGFLSSFTQISVDSTVFCVILPDRTKFQLTFFLLNQYYKVNYNYMEIIMKKVIYVSILLVILFASCNSQQSSKSTVTVNGKTADIDTKSNVTINISNSSESKVIIDGQEVPLE